MTKERLIHLDFLRALAIIFVLLFHLDIKTFKHGYLGVDVFFILSGFLMYKYFDKKFNKKRLFQYYLNRAFRVIPLYLIINFVVLIISFFYFISPHEFYLVVKHYFFSAFFLPNLGYWFEESYFGSMTLRPLLNFWSLGVEIQYYLIFPLIFIFLNKKFNSKIFILIFISLSTYIFFSLVSPKTGFFLLPTRLWEFLLGTICARYLSKKFESDTNKIGSISFFFIFLFIIFLGLEDNQILEKNYYILTIIISILTALVLIYGLNKNFASNFFFKTIFLKISKYSYSLYAVHFPIIIFFAYTPFRGNMISLSNLNQILFVIVLIIISTIVSFHLIENKFRQSVKYKFLSYVILLNCIFSTFLFVNIKDIYKKFSSQEKYNISFAVHDRSKFRCGKLGNLINLNKNTCLISEKNNNKNNILLFGDSQADSIKIQLIKSADKINYNLMLYKKNLKLNSNLSMNKLITEINENHYKIIIIHSYPGNTNLNILEKILMMEKFKDVKFVYILPPPIYENSIPQKLFSQYVLEKSRIKRKTYSQHKEENANEYSYVNKLKSYKNFYSIDISKEICNVPTMMKDKKRFVCRLMTTNFEPFYFDNHHFTNTGAIQLEKILDRSLQEISR